MRLTERVRAGGMALSPEPAEITMQTLRIAPAPPWERDHAWREVHRITCEVLGLPAEQVCPESRLGEVLTFDSLDVVEYIMQLEVAFQVRIDDQTAGRLFTERMTLAQFCDVLLELNRGGRAPGRRRGGVPDLAPVESVAFTQLGDRVSEREWCAGPLHERLSPTAEGTPQYRRRTDGMRCVLLPGDVVEVGGDGPEALPDQQPRHAVAVSPVLMDAE